MVDFSKNSEPISAAEKLKNLVSILIGLVLFVLSIQLITGGFKNLGEMMADSVMQATSNPFIGFFIGLLVTAILQSSSTTTTMTVALVAAGTLPLTQAVPIVIGANVGTTLTSTLVSLSYITKRNEFVKAFSAGTVHDLFNIFVALILFPLELRYQLLSTVSAKIGSVIPVAEGPLYIRGINSYFDPIILFFTSNLGPTLTILVGLILLFSIVKFVSSLLYKRWFSKTQSDGSTLNSNIKSFGWGLLITSAIQSSSLSTSLMVPLVATGQVKLKRAFIFIIGANLGTTVTALFAALFESQVAISLAIAHLIFNLVGCLFFLLIPALNRLITFTANQLAILTLRNRMMGLAYILLTFFILPFTLIYLSKTTNVLHAAKTDSQTIEFQKHPTDLLDSPIND
jgi:sodium-dependent phosphate cotransporter